MDNRKYCEVVNNTILKYNVTRKQFDVGVNSPETACSDKGYYLVVGASMPYNPELYTQTSTYVINEPNKQVDKVYTNVAISDETLRSNYETSMNTTMITSQVDALGDPAVHRYTQGMTRYTSLVGKIVGGGTPTTEELAYMDGAEVGLQYQEVNALSFAGAVASIASLSGQAILDYPMPNFTMNPATHSGYQPYLDYLNNGYV